MDIPPALADYVLSLTVEHRSPAFLLVDSEGDLTTWGGALGAYGIAGLRRGESVAEQLFFLEGLLPLQGAPLYLPRVKIESSISADIHIVPAEGGDWILMLDAHAEAAQLQFLQQKVNDLSLLRYQQGRLFDQYLAQDVAAKLAQGLLTFPQQGDRREVTILFASVKGFLSYSERESPDIVFRALNQYSRAISQPLQEEAGLLSRVVGDGVMAVFGVLPATLAPARQAVQAAFRVVEAVNELNQTRSDEAKPTFEIGIGVTSGPVAIGILGGKGRPNVSLVGKHVDLAVQLEHRAKSGEILVDDNTFQQLDERKSRFVRQDLVSSDLAETKPVYSYVGEPLSRQTR